MPGTSTSTLQIVVSLLDNASSGMQTLADKMNSIGSSLTAAGRTMTTDITLPIVGAATASAAMADQFQAALLKIQTGAGASAAEVSSLSSTILSMSENGAQQTPLDIANGMYYIESAGYHGSEAVSVLKAAMDGANVSGVDLNTVAQQLVTVMNATHSPISDAENVMGLLNSTVGQGVMTMTDLIGAMSTGIIPKAEAVGLGINDVAAALDTMTREGVPAQDAATRLGMTLSLMASPTAQAVKALESIGLTQTSLADTMRSQGLIPALTELETALKNSGDTAVQQNDVIAKAFGGGRTSGAVELLLQNLGQMQTAFDGLGGGVEQFSGYVQAQGETTAAYIDRMKASMAAASIQIGDALAPLEAEIFPKLAAAIQDVTQWFVKLSPEQKNVLLGFLGFAAAVGPILLVAGAIMKVGAIAVEGVGYLLSFSSFILGTVVPAIAEFATFLVSTAIPAVIEFATAVLLPLAPFILIGAAVAALAYLIYSNWQSIENFTKEVFQVIGNIITTAIDFAVGVIITDITALDPKWRAQWQAISDFAQRLWADIKNFVSTAVADTVAAIQTPITALADWWRTTWQGFSDFFEKIWNGISNFVSGIINSIIGFFNELGSSVGSVMGKVTAPLQTIASFIGGIGTAVGGAINNLIGTGGQATGLNAYAIPKLATGGIVSSPTLALVGEAGPEAVIPLSAFAGGMGLAGGGGGTGGGNIIINLAGATISDASTAMQYANLIAKAIQAQLRLKNYA